MRTLKQVIITSLVILIASYVIFDNILSVKHTMASSLNLPEPGQFLKLSNKISDPVLKGLTIDPNNPLSIEFIFDTNDFSSLKQEEAARSISYFMAALTTPNQNLWVNLSPYEENRVIDDVLAETNLGKDMLAQDYILKQISASLTSPDTELGRKYWAASNGLQGEAIPVMDKLWIEPSIAEIYESNSSVMITKSELKIETEHELIKEFLVPEITKEVNEGKHFSKIRQVYNALILARWFKESFIESFYANYFGSSKIDGIELEDKEIKDKIFKLYVEAFEKGVYKKMKNVRDPQKDKIIKKQYFAGGETFVEIPIKQSSSVVNDLWKFIKGKLFGVKIDLMAIYKNKLVLKDDPAVLADWLAQADLVSTDSLEVQYANSIKTHTEANAIGTVKMLFQPILDYNPPVLKDIQIKDVKYLSKGNNAQVGYFESGDKKYVIRRERIDLTKVNATKKIAENLRGFAYQKEFAKKGFAPDVLNIRTYQNDDGFFIEQLSYYGGRSYEELRAKDYNYTQERALKHCRQLIDIVDYAASRNLVLADLKPNNIVVDENDDLRIIDFPMIQKSGTQLINPYSHKVYSTINTMDPSLYEKMRIYFENDIRIDPNTIIYEKASDIFALGSLLFFALTGKKLFVNDKGDGVATFNIAEATIMSRIADLGEERLVNTLQSMLNYYGERPDIDEVQRNLRYRLAPRTEKQIRKDIRRVGKSIKKFEKSIKKITKEMQSKVKKDEPKFRELHEKRLADKQGLARFNKIKEEYEENLKYASSSVGYGGIDFETVNLDISGKGLKFADVDIDFEKFSGFSFEINDIFKIDDLTTTLSKS